MSAQALREATVYRVRKQADDHTRILIEYKTASLDEMRYYQGVIEGLRIALSEQEEAYRAIGE